MSLSHTLTYTWSNGSTSITKSVPLTSVAEFNADSNIAPGTTNQEIDVALNVAQLESVFFNCNVPISIFTNTITGLEKIYLNGAPAMWTSAGSQTQLFTTTVTKFYVTTASSIATATLNIRAAYHKRRPSNRTRYSCRFTRKISKKGQTMYTCKQQHPYFHRLPRASGSYLPSTLAALYSFPKVTVNSLPTVYLLELGGGFNPTLINQWCQANNYPLPNLTAASVDGATNAYTGDPQSADVEVVLDICAVIGVVAEMTDKPANIVVLFAPNSNQGFLDAFSYVANKGNCACGVSWGSDEHGYSATQIAQFNSVLQAGANNGVTWCIASGDSGASDGDSGLNTDFPASSPWVVACGGTTITTSGSKITQEVVWNEGGGASGGGFSTLNPVPSYQNGFVPSGTSGRGVPDLVMDADPATGWQIATFGVIGGTSAVAPAMAGYFAVCSAVKGSAVGFVNPTLYANEATCFRDITAGNNSGYGAATGWDAASGLGAPLGDKLLAALTGSVAPPPVKPPPPPVSNPPPPPPVKPPPPVSSGPTLAQVVSNVDATFAAVEHKVPYYLVLPYLRYANAQVVANLTQLFAAHTLTQHVLNTYLAKLKNHLTFSGLYEVPSMTDEHKLLLKSAGFSAEFVDKAAANGWSLAQILQTVINNAPEVIAVLEDVLKLLPAQPSA